MKPKLFDTAISFVTTRKMYEQIKETSEVAFISQSELLRDAVSKYFAERRVDNESTTTYSTTNDKEEDEYVTT